MATVLAIAEALESGTFRGPLARALGAAWDAAAGPCVTRRIELPRGLRAVTVGGATLGGSGKTPLAIACAAQLATEGARVALIGHAYRARPARARVVRPGDPIDEVGDEALVAAAELGPRGVPVVIAPSRAAALELAARLADVVVLDGIAQIAPAPAALALLAVQADEPWGRSGAAPPAGDLRAPIRQLLAACDAIVPLGEGEGPRLEVPRPVWPARVESRGAWVEGAELLTWNALRSWRVGLFCALARPDRLVRALARRGVTPGVVVRVRDHGPLGSSAFARLVRARDIDLWLATPKCALHLEACRPGGERAGSGGPRHLPVARLARLDASLVLGPSLCARLRGLARP